VKKRRCDEKKGFVLILTLWILAILSLWLWIASSTTKVGLQFASYFRKKVRAQYLARGAIRRLVAEIASLRGIDKEKNKKIITGYYLGKWVVYPEKWKVKKLTKSFEKVRGNEFVICKIKAEDSKIPVNYITDKMMRKMKFLDPVVIQRIITWRKTHKKQGGFRFTEEFLKIEGISPELYFGKKNFPGLKDIFTSYSKGKIYINGITKKEILKIIPGVDRDLASEIEEILSSGKKFSKIEDLKHVMGVTPVIYKSLTMWVKVFPAFYRIEAEAHVGGVVANASAVYFIRGRRIKLYYFSGG